MQKFPGFRNPDSFTWGELSVKHVWRRCNLPYILSNVVALKSYLKSETKIEPDPRLEEA